MKENSIEEDIKLADEEKKAIKYVNNILDYELHYCEDEDVLLLTRIDKEQIKTILNLIQKQQKEIEKLKKQNIFTTIDFIKTTPQGIKNTVIQELQELLEGRK